MSNNVSKNIRDVEEALGLKVEEVDEDNSTLSGVNYAWYVGATGNDENGHWRDFSDNYIKNGTWENLYESEYFDKVNSVKIGDRIVIKSCYIQKNNLPFNNNGKTVAVMCLKAIGTVVENSFDGKHLKVQWEKLEPNKIWYGQGVLRNTIHLIKASDGFIKKSLLDFTFGNVTQDYSICEDYYEDEEVINEDELIEIEKIDYDNVESRIKGGENIILYGVPGAGKSFTLENDYVDENTTMERVVFHPDYTYSDFVGQILPKSKDGDVSYNFIPGPFAKIVRDAYINPTKKYILAIEEINRGNAPAIFGDVFQLLDRDQSGRSRYTITNADIAKVVFGDESKEIYIPSNLSLICTMNTSDQNVFTLDTAFQRRWNMRLIENVFKKNTPEEKAFAEHPILDTTVTWENFCETINAQILDKNQNMTSSEDKRLGTHFVLIDYLIYDPIEVDESATLQARHQAELRNRRFPEKVIKYLWDDAFKFYRDEIFNPNYNSLEKVISAFATATGNDRFKVFKDNIKAAIEDGNKNN